MCKFSWCQQCLSTVGVRYSHFCLEIFRQLTSLRKCTSISTKIGLCIHGCIIYKTAYNSRQSLFPIPKTSTFNTATNRLLTSLCFSLCTCLIMTSREFLVMEQCVNMIIIRNLYSIMPMNKHNRIYVYETENNDLRFSQFLSHCVSDCGFYKIIKCLNSRNAFKKNKPLPPHCPL